MEKIRFIADIGSNHNNDLSRIRLLIEEAKQAGCWGVKFQLFKAKKLYAPGHIPEDLKDSELNPAFIKNIAAICLDNKIKFGCTPFDLESVDVIKPYVDFIKISSFDILRLGLILKCAKTKIPLHISTGMANTDEIRKAVIAANCVHVLYDCVSKYPAKTEDISMHKLQAFDTTLNTLMSQVKYKGWSDHSRKEGVIIAAVCNGARWIEVHLDRVDYKGIESKHGHCWDMFDLKIAIENANDAYKVMVNMFAFSTEEERRQRADSKDGLRPMQIARNWEGEKI